MYTSIALFMLFIAAHAAPYDTNITTTAFANDTMPISLKSNNPFQEKAETNAKAYNKAFLYVGVPIIGLIVAIILICVVLSCCKTRAKGKMTQAQMSEHPGLPNGASVA